MGKIDQTKGKLPGSRSFGSTRGPFVTPSNWVFPTHIVCPTVNLIALIYSRPRGFLACQPGGQRSRMPRSDSDEGIGRMHGSTSPGVLGSGSCPMWGLSRGGVTSPHPQLQALALEGGERGDAGRENPAGFHCCGVRAGAPRAGEPRALQGRVVSMQVKACQARVGSYLLQNSHQQMPFSFLRKSSAF